MGYIIKKNKIVETVKIEKVIDKQAVLEAVKKERDNIYKSIKQTKVKETFKKPNGETTIIEKIETNTDENKIIRSDLSLNIEQKTHENDVISTNSFDHFNLSIYGGAGITNINMNQIDNLESIVFKAYSGIKFIYNSTPNLSSSIRYEYQFIKNSHSVMAEVEQKF